MNIVSSYYYGFLLKLLENREVIFAGNSPFRPAIDSIYNGEISTAFKVEQQPVIFSSQEEFDKYHISKKELKPSSVSTKNLVFIKTTDIRNLSVADHRANAYIFVYNRKDGYDQIIDRYHEYIFDDKILTVMMDNECCSMISKLLSQPNSNVNIEIAGIGGPFWLRMLILLLFLGIVFGFHYGCKSIILYVSKFDPIFSDFEIGSSNIIKFKDLSAITMPQCSICFEEFIPEDDVRVLTCKHYYHPECVDRWLIGHSKHCPCCRNDVEINEKV